MANKYADKSIWGNKYFPDPLDPTEDIIMVLRQDVVIISLNFLAYLIIFLVVTLLRSVLSTYIIDISFGKELLDISYFTFNIIILVICLLRFHDYFLTIQLLTSKRVIDVTQKGLFGRETNELAITAIEDGSYKQTGLFATIFNYGDVILQTASGGSKDTSGFIFKNIPNPSRVHKIIMDYFHDIQNKEIKAQNTKPSFNPNIQPQIYNQQIPNTPPQQNIQLNLNQRYPNPLPPKYRESVINYNQDNEKKS